MIRTYQDAVEHLLDLLDLDPTDRNRRQCRRAIDQAYRELPQRARWSYFDRALTLITNAPYSTGTVTYDHTGGTYERQLTLATGTWPTWARFGRVTIDEAKYEVQERVSSTVLILKENTNPGEDVASTTYSIDRVSYDLPANCRRVTRVYSQDDEAPVWIATIDGIRDAHVSESTPSTPWQVAIHGSGDSYGRMSVVFTPPPSEALKYDIWYEASPRELVTERETLGTVTISAAGTTITGASTAFSSAHEGAIIRLSSSTSKEPTSRSGNKSDGLYNPYVFQTRIRRAASTTSLIVDDAAAETLTSVKYVISDPIDVEPTSMWTAFLRMAEAELARLLGDKSVEMRQRDANAALRAAMENDQRTVRTDFSPVMDLDPTINTE
jgi:hypothetical protein